MKKLTSILLTIAVLTSLITSINAYNSKIYDSKLIEALNNANEDDLIEIYLWLKDPDYSSRVEDSEVLSGKSAMSHDEADAYLMSFRSEVKDITTRYNEEFLSNHVNPEREIIYFSYYTATLALEATPAEILYYAELEQVTGLSLHEQSIGSNHGGTPKEADMTIFQTDRFGFRIIDYTIYDALNILRYLAKLPSGYDGGEIKPTIDDALNILRVLAKLDLD